MITAVVVDVVVVVVVVPVVVFVRVLVKLLVESCKHVGNGLPLMLLLPVAVCHTCHQFFAFPRFYTADSLQVPVFCQYFLDLCASCGPFDCSDLLLDLFAEFAPHHCVLTRRAASLTYQLF